MVEERAVTAENELDAARTRITELEAELKQTKASLDQVNKPSRGSSRGGPKNSVSKRSTNKSTSRK